VTAKSSSTLFFGFGLEWIMHECCRRCGFGPEADFCWIIRTIHLSIEKYVSINNLHNKPEVDRTTIQQPNSLYILAGSKNSTTFISFYLSSVSLS
jgi:hypothetical protein